MVRTSDSGHYCRLLWLPPMMQELFDPFWRVIDSGLLSGLYLRRFLKPLAGMVICRSGPNLTHELYSSAGSPGFPDLDLFDRCAHSGHRSLTLPFAPVLAGYDLMLKPPPTPDSYNPPSSSTWPRSAAPSCWQAQSLPTSSACGPASGPTTSPQGSTGAQANSAATSHR